MRFIKGRGRWLVAAGAAGLLLAQLLSWAPVATGANEKPGEPVDLRGFATGQPAHVDALNSGETRVVDAEVAWSAASVDADADGLAGVKQNEFTRTIHPDLGDKMSHARGSGLELGLATTPIDENQLQLSGKAEADAPPPSSDLQEIGLEGLDPIAYASLLRGVAVANSEAGGLVPDVCVLGDDISRGIGFAADVELLDVGGDTDAPNLDAPVLALDDNDVENDPESVSQSTSRTKLVPAGGNQFGLMAEVRQTIAPVQLLQVPIAEGEFATLEIKLLGEWVLRAVATGEPGGASIFYGPGDASPQTNVLEIIGLGDPILLTLQDLLGDEGLNIPLAPLLDIQLGEDPRAIAAPGANPDQASSPSIAANGRSASAAVDVLRVRILDGAVADVRVGHMEVSVEVPDGGVTCPIPVTKTADPTDIFIAPTEPDTSHIEITVHNVFDCDLTNTVLTDRIRTVEGSPQFRLLNDDPETTSPDIPEGDEGLLVTDGAEDVVWNLGTIPKGTTKKVSIDLRTVDSGGVLEDIATAEGQFANCVGEDATGLAINGLDLSGFSIPVQVRIELPRTGADALRTMAMGGGLALAASSLGLFLRRRSRRAA